MSEKFLKRLIQEAGDVKEFESTLNIYSRLILTALIDELKSKGLIEEKNVIKRLNDHINKINAGKTDSGEIKDLFIKLSKKSEDYIG